MEGMADIPTQAEVDATFKNLEDSSRRYISASFRQDGKSIASTGVAVKKHRAALLEACTTMIERIAELEHIAELAMQVAANCPHGLALDAIYNACERAGIGQSKEDADDEAAEEVAP